MSTGGLCASFKGEILQGLHNIGGSAPDSLKCALYASGGNLSPTATTAYPTSSGTEVTDSTGGYKSGGVAVANTVAPAVNGATAYWTPSSDIQFPSMTVPSFDTALIYNASNKGGVTGRAIGLISIAPTAVTAGTYTISMPTNAATSALLQLT